MFWVGVGLAVFGIIQLLAAGSTFLYLKKKVNIPQQTLENDQPQQQQQQQQPQAPPTYEELVPHRRNWRETLRYLCPCGCGTCTERDNHDHDQR